MMAVGKVTLTHKIDPDSDTLERVRQWTAEIVEGENDDALVVAEQEFAPTREGWEKAVVWATHYALIHRKAAGEKCGFIRAWIGPCTKLAISRNGRCADCAPRVCWKCGEPAVQDCSWAGQFVCGVPYCSKHRHERTH